MLAGVTNTQENLPSMWLFDNLDAEGLLLYHLNTKPPPELRQGRSGVQDLLYQTGIHY